VHQCSKLLCMDLQRWPDGKTVVTFSHRFPTSEDKVDAVNIRPKNGGQIEICATCPWTFSTQPGASYTFSAQDCVKGTFSSDCSQWEVFHYTAPKAAAAGPSVSNGPVKQAGKVKGGAPPLPICDAASQARARNSPAAPGLEAQCRAALAAGQDAVAVEKSPAATVLKGAGQVADLTVVSLTGPGTLKAGLSGTFKVVIKNIGTASATVELHIIFAKAIDQTGQIVAGAGLACAIGHDTGINTGLNCTGGKLAPGESATVIVQGRGQTAGIGVLLATLNPSHVVQESNYNNNIKQLNVTIN